MQVSERSSHIGGDEIEQSLGGGCKATNPQLIGQHDDGDTDAGNEVVEIAIVPVLLEITATQFIVGRREFGTVVLESES